MRSSAGSTLTSGARESSTTRLKLSVPLIVSSLRRRTIRGSSNAFTTSPEPSRLALSRTISSKSVKVWLSTLRTVSPMYARFWYSGTHTETAGLRAETGPSSVLAMAFSCGGAGCPGVTETRARGVDLQLRVDHDLREAGDQGLRLPAEHVRGPRRVSDQRVHLRGAQVRLVELDVVGPVEAHAGEAVFGEVADRVGSAGGQDEIVRFVVLQHTPHTLHVLGCEPPVTNCVEVAQVDVLLDAEADPGRGPCQLAGHERLPTARRLVVEQDPVDREEPVPLAVVPCHPVGVDLGGAVGRPRVEGRVLALRRRCRSEHLRAGRLVEAGVEPDHADRLEQPGGADAGGVAGVLRLVEADADVRLRAQVVHLV